MKSFWPDNQKTGVVTTVARGHADASRPLLGRARLLKCVCVCEYKVIKIIMHLVPLSQWRVYVNRFGRKRHRFLHRIFDLYTRLQ